MLHDELPVIVKDAMIATCAPRVQLFADMMRGE
jgi:hypothetical protein